MYQLNEKKDGWVEIEKLKTARFVARMVPGPDATLVVLAGASPNGMQASVERVHTTEK